MHKTSAFLLFNTVLFASLVACSTGAPPVEESVRRTAQAIDLASPPVWPTAAQWVSVKKGTAAVTDPTGDAQGARDVVGNALNPSAFIWADAAHMYFRIRIGASPMKTATTLDPFGWGCELETDGTASTYEYFINVNGIITGDIVQLLQNTTKQTDNPKDTSEVTLMNGVSNAAGGYSPLTGSAVINGTAPHARVTAAGTTLGGGTDYFVDFALDKNDFPVAPAVDAFNPNTQAFRVVCGTSNNAANLAADLSSPSGATTLTDLVSDPLFCGTTGCSAGCFVDANCAAAEFCTAPTCVAKLVNGTAMPTVAGHTPVLNGTCTAAAATAVCVSAVCDAADNKCGLANGSGPCTAVNGGTVCRSGACVAGLCAAPVACTTDANCGAAQFCNTQTSLCVAKLTNDTAIPTITGHTPPLVGTCSAAVGTAVCSAAVCDVSDNKCGFANGNGTCSAATASLVCRSGTCSPAGICVAAGGCVSDASCTALEFCNTQTTVCLPKLANSTAIPTIAGHTPALTGTCTAAAGTSVCTAAVCDTADNLCGFANGHTGCDAANAGTVCRSGFCSAANVCVGAPACTVDANCAATEFCNTQTSTCATKLSNGVAIPTITGHTPALDATCSAAVGTAVCAAGVCDVTDHKCGFADGNGACTVANAATVCRTGVCSASSICGPTTAVCTVDADCAATQFCNTQTTTCATKLSNGVAIPTITGHTPPLTGACDAAVGAAVCAAAVCDGADNLCGFANDHGTCSAANAAVVCRSGNCSATGVCSAPPVGGCAVDADCTGAQFCNTETKTCVSRVANGLPVPTIPGHTPALTGTCSAAVGTAVCTSRVCDATDNKCGFADGRGACTQADASIVCRTGACSSTGTCGAAISTPPGGCTADTDCTAVQYCDKAAKVCAPKITNGTALPTGGTCTEATGRAACAAGVCDVIDNRCGFADGHGTCSSANATTVCRSGLCGSDNHCAFVDDGTLEGGGCNASGSSQGPGVYMAMLFAVSAILRNRRRGVRA